tara:strand:- start:255 stop:563 length:309 start_codon:yes stop_codon:yes gene_type:complete
MKKFLVISLILSLILITALIKNSTKRVDDEIFVVKENIRVFEKDLGDLKLENNYLGSGKKLMEFQSQYFNEHLEFKRLKKISILVKDKERTIIKNLDISKSD